MSRALDYVASLIHDVDNNVAENFNSVVRKFVGGKLINYSSRRSYETRCYDTVVSFNMAGWYRTQLQETVFGQDTDS